VAGSLCKEIVVTNQVWIFSEFLENLTIDRYPERVKKYSHIEWLKDQSAVFNGKYSPEFIGMFTRFSYGMAFNMAPSDQLFNDEVAEDFLGSDKFRLKNIDETFDLVHMNQSDYPLKGSKGLQLHFDPHPFDLWAFPRYICQPMRFLVHSPYEIPGGYEDTDYCLFYHGNDLEVLITPEIVKSDESLRSYPAEIRNCYFEDERKLRYFKKYTKNNCKTECYSNYTINYKDTLCKPYYIIRSRDEKVCDFRDYYLSSFSRFMYIKDEFEKSCNCLDECNYIKYNFEIVSSDLKVKTINEYDA
jgi:Amiloride-sensitive sodium channel